MRKVDNGEKKREKKKEKNVVFSGHYVIASSRPPNDDRWNAACLCQYGYLSSIGIGLNHNPGIVIGMKVQVGIGMALSMYYWIL